MITHYCCVKDKCYIIYSKFEDNRIKYELAIADNIYGMDDLLKFSNAKNIPLGDFRNILDSCNALSISTYAAATKKEEGK